MAEMEINEEQYQKLLELNGGELDMGKPLNPEASKYLADLARDYESKQAGDNNGA
jgi:hypothetical protein